MLFTAHASRTHVKAPQTDFPVKHDNSSDLTHDSPSETRLRTKVTFQPKTAPKSIENTKPQEGHPSQASINSHPCTFQARNRNQGPKGSIETKTVLLLDAQSHGRNFEDIRSDPMAPCLRHRSHRCSATIGLSSKPLDWDWLTSGTQYGSPRSRITLLPTRVSDLVYLTRVWCLILRLCQH